ncbi:hypothetical protein IAR55_006113 [Kwoniella newhampshirensis]|uniref:Integrase zinc-binding domain-containing protein n=1 Tax=Kwoniella newhampshirensis TaxID=1651941 RepID=A0AAW0YFA2_9TREE
MADRETRSSLLSPLSPPDRSSLPFQYSTARPPTGFSEVETAWSQPSHAIPPVSPSPPPPLPYPLYQPSKSRPSQRVSHAENPFGGIEEEYQEAEDGQSTLTGDLYQRSDWNGGDHDQDLGTAWIKRSWAGPKTSGVLQGFEDPTTIDGWEWSRMSHETENGRISAASPADKGVEYAYDQDAIMDSPNEMTPAPERGRRDEQVNRESSSKSTLPSVLDLERLGSIRPPQRQSMSHVPLQASKLPEASTITGPNSAREIKNIDKSDPFADSSELVTQGNRSDPSTRRRSHYIAQTTPDFRPHSQDMSRGRGPADPRDKGGPQANNNYGGQWKGMSDLTPNLISPEAQERLGRMSVAPARYSLPPKQRNIILGRRKQRSKLDEVENPGSINDEKNSHSSSKEVEPLSEKKKSWSRRIQSSRIVRFHTKWKPFITPLNTLAAVIPLTICINSVGGKGSSELVKVDKGVFDVSEAGDKDVGLGSWGWCAFSNGTSQCQAYGDGDFATSSGSIRIPGSPTLSNLSSLLTALTTITWLLVLFQLITAFLHWYLFFALSLPFTHLVDSTITTTNEDRAEDEAGKNKADIKRMKEVKVRAELVAEVGLRVQCERPPYEGYQWVWWAWWAHRRGPVGPIFALTIGLLSLITFVEAVLFKIAIEKATKSTGVHLGKAASLPLMTLLNILEPFIESIKYLFNPRSKLNTFLNPPSPSPTVLLLPASEKKMRHVRPNTNASSFFAPRQTAIGQPHSRSHPRKHNHNRGGEGAISPQTAYPLLSPPPSQIRRHPSTGSQTALNLDLDLELDPETIRWLAAYPTDEELVPLISDLRSGRDNDDFILSDVGLLYLRPTPGDPDREGREGDEGGAALLVPPKGTIRKELIEDAHLDPDPSSSSLSETNHGGMAHNDVEATMEILSRTFWWNGMDLDVREWVERCKVCKERERKGNQAGLTGVSLDGD